MKEENFDLEFWNIELKHFMTKSTYNISCVMCSALGLLLENQMNAFFSILYVKYGSE